MKKLCPESAPFRRKQGFARLLSIGFLIVTFAVFMLTGCSLDDTIPLEEDIDYMGEVEDVDPLKNYPDLNENQKTQLRELYRLWKKFDNAKRQNINPTDDFHNSEYKVELINFLSQKESLSVSDNDLVWILEQPGYEAIDKTILLSNGTEFNIRVISYHVDYYVQAITDFVALPNNLIFVQCWNDNEFYFTIISDGDIHTVYDFFPLETDGIFHIILTGTSFPGYPQPPFLWDWKFGAEGFEKGDLFDFAHIETDKYYIYDNVDYDKNQCLMKWTFQTDGAFITIERDDENNQFAGLLRVSCEVLDNGRRFLFTSADNINEIKPDIQILLKNKSFVIE